MAITSSLLKDKAFIDGAWVEARSGAAFDVRNPADGSVVARVPDMRGDDARAGGIAGVTEHARDCHLALPVETSATI